MTVGSFGSREISNLKAVPGHWQRVSAWSRVTLIQKAKMAVGQTSKVATGMQATLGGGGVCMPPLGASQG